MTEKEIMADLKDIRYYYSRKKVLDGLMGTKQSSAAEKASVYGNIMASAPPRLYDLYIGLYVMNNTQYGLAEQWGYSEIYIKVLGRKLRKYLLDIFNKQQGGESQWNGVYRSS